MVTANADARDAAIAGGTTWVVAAGSVVAETPDGRQRVLTWGDGLATSLPSAVCAAGGVAIVGGVDGSLTLLDGETSHAARFTVAGVNDLLCRDARVLVASHDGLYDWNLDGTMATRRLAGADVTAVTESPGGVVAGLSDGSVVLLGEGGTTSVLAAASDESVTALAYANGTLWIGRPNALDRIDGGRVMRARTDVHVSALLPDGPRLLVGTTDAGVLALGSTGSGGERRLLGDARVARLRRLGDRAVAIADGAVYAVADGGPVLGPPPHGLGDLAIAGVALSGSEVWVGGGRGIDVLDGHGAWLRREAARDAILALEARPESGEMVVGTTAGVVVLGPHAPRRVGEREGLLGARVLSSTSLAGATAYVTDLGVTIIDDRGVAVRLACGDALPAGSPTAAIWGPRGRLFVGTAGGVVVVRAGRVESTLATGAVFAMAPGAGGVYAATSSGIVLARADGSLVRLGGPTSTSPGALAVEPQPTEGGASAAADGERIYAGTASGLWVSGRAWQLIATPPLLPGPVTSVALDDGAVWIGTDRGLVRLARSVLESTLAPPRS